MCSYYNARSSRGCYETGTPPPWSIRGLLPSSFNNYRRLEQHGRRLSIVCGVQRVCLVFDKFFSSSFDSDRFWTTSREHCSRTFFTTAAVRIYTYVLYILLCCDDDNNIIQYRWRVFRPVDCDFTYHADAYSFAPRRVATHHRHSQGTYSHELERTRQDNGASFRAIETLYTHYYLNVIMNI